MYLLTCGIAGGVSRRRPDPICDRGSDFGLSEAHCMESRRGVVVNFDPLPGTSFVLASEAVGKACPAPAEGDVVLGLDALKYERRLGCD